MKVLFVASSLGPFNGVGDYSRSLARECVRQGHACALLGLNDAEIDKTEAAAGAEGSLATLRLPAGDPWSSRLPRARRFIEEFAPDWISLQFVCYGFDPRGLPFGLTGRLARLFEGFRLQVMLHELWIGAQGRDPLKERLVGALQRRLILSLLRGLAPARIHTSNPLYRARLGRRSVRCELLPLFGNIPIEDNDASEWLYPELRRRGFPIDVGARAQSLLFGLFGSVYPAWPLEPLMSDLLRAGRSQGLKIAVISIGRQGPSGVWNELERRYADRLAVLRLGEQPPSKVSQLLNSLDFGLATTPYALIGKSSSAVAMFEHGLPVLINRDDVEWDAGSAPEAEPLAHLWDSELTVRLTSLAKAPARARLPGVATRFLDSLASAP